MFVGNPTPPQNGRVMNANNPRNRRRATGTSNNLSDFHGCHISTQGNERVKPYVSHRHPVDKESVDERRMPQGPRRSRKKINRGGMGERVRDLRLARKLTQMELAVEAGVSRAHVAKIEGGARPPGRDTLHAIAQFFGVSMDFLQSGSTEAPNSSRVVDRPDQLALLDLWEAIPESERPRIIRLIRAAALD